MFSNEADLLRADWPLLQNGATNLFWNPSLWREAQESLRTLGYEVAEISCREGRNTFCHKMSAVLRWHAQFGYSPWDGNLNALNDGVRGYPFGPSRRAALAFDGFDALAEADPEWAQIVLDILEASARDQLLWGRTLIMLVQVDDPDFDGGTLGGRSAQWNRKEWFRAARG
ncbi:MAG: barstar family protein [Proteobacteria bacterium]|nr:barstar family protein [Pseudomonadota bacterium]